MFAWSNSFNTAIESVDRQHQKLIEMVGELSERFENGWPELEWVDHALKELIDYADQHFLDEELLMARYKLDPRHVSLHHMEHKSFIYDLKSMYENLYSEEDLIVVWEKLVRFATSWLTCHILGFDRMMARQIAAIQQGATPVEAHDAECKVKLDYETTYLIMQSVLDLWHMTLERCHKLENKLQALKKSQEIDG